MPGMRFNWQKAKALVDSNRLRRKAIAADCAVTEGSFKMVLTGHANPSRRVVRLLSQVLKIDENELYVTDSPDGDPKTA